MLFFNTAGTALPIQLGVKALSVPPSCYVEVDDDVHLPAPFVMRTAAIPGHRFINFRTKSVQPEVETPDPEPIPETKPDSATPSVADRFSDLPSLKLSRKAPK